MKKKASSKSRPSPGASAPSAPGAANARSAEDAPAPKVGTYSAGTGFFIAIALLLYLGQAEGCYNHGLFSAAVYEPYADLRSIPRVGGEVNRFEAGREVYAAMCVACHQPNGSGNPANQCPPLAESEWVLAEGPNRLIRIVLHGARGEMMVKGQKWNSPAGMTPFGPALSDDQIANVLTYIRQEKAWGNAGTEVTPEMVKAVRDATADRTTPWTAAELERIPVLD